MGILANLSDTTANAQAAALAFLCNLGLIQIYAGPQPATANAPLTGANILLATLTFGSPAFGSPVGGLLTANPITPGTAIATGTAVFARIYQQNDVTVVMDCQVATAGAYINLNTTLLVGGATVSVSSFQHSVTET